MPAAIMPYSMVGAPDSFLQKAHLPTLFSIGVVECSALIRSIRGDPLLATV
jgi:hypothetical protein